jgi:polyphenol oxidase
MIGGHVDPGRPWPAPWIVPDWPVSDRVRAVITTRAGGVSLGPWGDGDLGGMNLGTRTGDADEQVDRNRRRLAGLLPQAPRWLALRHGAGVVDAESVTGEPAPADASTATLQGVVCCVTVADCLPVLLADRQGRVIGAAHAGWRGLAGGVIQATVQAMRARVPGSAGDIVAFLGPCIGPDAFEVGDEVLMAMQRQLPDAGRAFRPLGGRKLLADLPELARQALAQVGVHGVYGGRWCTYSDPGNFYSFRRDRITGRHAALIWRHRGGDAP